MADYTTPEARKAYVESLLNNPNSTDLQVRQIRALLGAAVDPPSLPLHRTEVGYPNCATCDGGGCPDCTDPA